MRIIKDSPNARAALKRITQLMRRDSHAETIRLDTAWWTKVGHPMANQWRHDDGGVIDLDND